MFSKREIKVAHVKLSLFSAEWEQLRDNGRFSSSLPVSEVGS